MRESDIMYENGNFWVAKQKNCYTVFKSDATYSVSDCSFDKNINGLSLAIAYCQYRGKQGKMKTKEIFNLAKALHNR